jgi:hypothetical protein
MVDNKTLRVLVKVARHPYRSRMEWIEYGVEIDWAPLEDAGLVQWRESRNPSQWYRQGMVLGDNLPVEVVSYLYQKGLMK